MFPRSQLLSKGYGFPGLPLGLPFRLGECCEGGLDRLGKKRWTIAVFDVVARLKAALVADYIVLGGGNVKKLKKLPPDCRQGDNKNAFIGGFRLWESHAHISDGKAEAAPEPAQKVV